MPLYIRDNEVDALATELQSVTNAPSKTAAVKAALVNELARSRKPKSIRERLAPLQEQARAMGLPNSEFDTKKFMDELSGE